uniref:Cleavage/polyadenylation specificity factor A subunit N-terminal domain-containing protein n=1 Tax=Chromera velia CCMP2878 TaxID=1169474 RepID=A0A0K6S616_9ALVE|eukprot:Cvel_14945.t2-p1 / transcript=Cvel_14945.t2 / gene=Cvel_14945 / organism=Chromera_velia_CCMP2878 / gene_product=DNA damage-binding protein 1, putative / transcript_product=DNA damage-binding protein 1, putative / location=Cvel_scaffold1084:35022-48831(+) / protein_length=1581 / sequence_SO=supercontig / SO=protein_coding / is_pseudo=false
MAEYNYFVTAHKATSVSCAVGGSFTSDGDVNVVMAKNDNVEVHRVTTEGLQECFSVPFYGKVAALQLVKTPNSKLAYLFALTKELKWVLMKYNPKKGVPETLAEASVAEDVRREADGVTVRVDPYARCVVMHTHSGCVKVLPIDTSKRDSLKEMFFKDVGLDLRDMVIVDEGPEESQPGSAPLLCTLQKRQSYTNRKETYSLNLFRLQRETIPSASKLHKAPPTPGSGGGVKKKNSGGGLGSRAEGHPIDLGETPCERLAAVPAAVGGGVLAFGQNEIFWVGADGGQEVIKLQTPPMSPCDVAQLDSEGKRWILASGEGGLFVVHLTEEGGKSGGSSKGKVKGGSRIELEMLAAPSNRSVIPFTSSLVPLQPLVPFAESAAASKGKAAAAAAAAGGSSSVSAVSRALVEYAQSRVFVGASIGDSLLVRLHNSLEEAEAARGPEGPGEGFVSVEQSFENLGPVADALALSGGGNGQSKLLVACGYQRAGCVKEVRFGVGVREHARVDISGVGGIWAVGTRCGGFSGATASGAFGLVLSFADQSVVLALSGGGAKDKERSEEAGEEGGEVELEEVEGGGLERGVPTVYCGNLVAEPEEGTGGGGVEVITQVTASGVRIVSANPELSLLGEWSAPADVRIHVAAGRGSRVLLGTSRGGVILLKLCQEKEGGGVKAEVEAERRMDAEVACVSFSADPDLSDVCAVGLWSVRTALLALPSLLTLEETPLGGEIIPRSCLVAPLGPHTYLLTGMGDGSVLSFRVRRGESDAMTDVQGGTGGSLLLSGRRRVQLGTQPAHLSYFPPSQQQGGASSQSGSAPAGNGDVEMVDVNDAGRETKGGETGAGSVFVSCDRPSLIHWPFSGSSGFSSSSSAGEEDKDAGSTERESERDKLAFLFVNSEPMSRCVPFQSDFLGGQTGSSSSSSGSGAGGSSSGGGSQLRAAVSEDSLQILELDEGRRLSVRKWTAGKTVTCLANDSSSGTLFAGLMGRFPDEYLEHDNDVLAVGVGGGRGSSEKDRERENEFAVLDAEEMAPFDFIRLHREEIPLSASSIFPGSNLAEEASFSRRLKSVQAQLRQKKSSGSADDAEIGALSREAEDLEEVLRKRSEGRVEAVALCSIRVEKLHHVDERTGSVGSDSNHKETGVVRVMKVDVDAAGERRLSELCRVEEPGPISSCCQWGDRLVVAIKNTLRVYRMSMEGLKGGEENEAMEGTAGGSRPTTASSGLGGAAAASASSSSSSSGPEKGLVMKLVFDCKATAGVEIVQMQACGDILVVADVMKAASAFRLSVPRGNSESAELEEVGAAMQSVWSMAVSPLSPCAFLLADDHDNLMVYGRNVIDNSDEKRADLQEHAAMHSGHNITCIREGRLVGAPVGVSNADRGDSLEAGVGASSNEKGGGEEEGETGEEEGEEATKSKIWMSKEGAIGLVMPVRGKRRRFAHLMRLQDAVARVVKREAGALPSSSQKPAGGEGGGAASGSASAAAHEHWRRKNNGTTDQPGQFRGFVDGDLLEQLLDLPVRLQIEAARHLAAAAPKDGGKAGGPSSSSSSSSKADAPGLMTERGLDERNVRALLESMVSEVEQLQRLH